MSARLYGRDVGNGSLAVVTRGFREALEAAGVFEGLVALDRDGGSEEDEIPPGALARDGIFTGDLSLIHKMMRGSRHERHWVQVTPNSTFVPKQTLGAILQLPGPRILSCSSWGTQIIADALVEMGCQFYYRSADATHWSAPTCAGPEKGCTPSGTPFEIITVCHGVSGFGPFLAAIEDARRHYAEGQFRVVHFSTTEGERKGTLELVKAWAAVRQELPEKAQLYLVLDYPAKAALLQRLLHENLQLPEGISIAPRPNLDAERMSKFLCHMHLVACPSRGEGFGLLPLQARACGVPCIATVTTGHSAGHVQGGGMITIDQFDGVVPIDDGPAALAPAVRPEDIAASLRAAHLDWRGMSLRAVVEAPAVIEKWSWKQQLAPLLEQLR